MFYFTEDFRIYITCFLFFFKKILFSFYFPNTLSFSVYSLVDKFCFFFVESLICTEIFLIQIQISFLSHRADYSCWYPLKDIIIPTDENVIDQNTVFPIKVCSLFSKDFPDLMEKIETSYSIDLFQRFRFPFSITKTYSHQNVKTNKAIEILAVSEKFDLLVDK